MNILLDYVVPITLIEPTPQASTAFLKQVLVVVKPKGMVTPGSVTLQTAQAGIGAITDNLDAQQLLNAGMNRLYLLPVADLADVAAAIVGKENDFYTMLISSDFADADLPDLDAGLFDGVIGVNTYDDTVATAQAAITNRVVFRAKSANKAKNMFFAFGKLLSNALNWRNQQYITMPFADDVDTLGEANNYFDDKVSMVISDTQFGNRLGLFTAGGKAIVQPYITKNFQIDVQSTSLQYISGNQPQYTKKEAALLEDKIKKDVINLYIEREWITAGTVEILLQQQNFVASGLLNMSEPNALWRVAVEMKQTL